VQRDPKAAKDPATPRALELLEKMRAAK